MARHYSHLVKVQYFILCLKNQDLKAEYKDVGILVLLTDLNSLLVSLDSVDNKSLIQVRIAARVDFGSFFAVRAKKFKIKKLKALSAVQKQ